MWGLHRPVLPALMSFPKVWRLHMSLMPSFFAPRLALLVLMTSQALQNWISIGVDCCRWFVIFCCVRAHACGSMYELFIHRSCLTHILGVCLLCCCKWGFFLQAFCSVCPLASVWLCSGLTKAMLTLREIHSQGLWAGLWQGQAVRVHPSDSNCLRLGPTRPSQTWAGPFKSLCWRPAHKDPDFNQTRQGLFNWGLANPITSLQQAVSHTREC